MIRYRNVEHGRIVERPSEDEWLEASAAWSRLDEPDADEQNQDDQDEGSRD